MATKGIWIPIEVLKDKSLSMQEKLVLMEINQLVSLDNNSCFASNEHFSEMLNISKKSASNTISSLVKKGKIGLELSDRNHKRLLSIKDGLVSTKDGQLSIKDGESKDNKTSNKTSNSEYVNFLTQLKQACKYKTKVSKTKVGEKIFKDIKDKHKLFTDYIKHQEDKKDFAVRITSFMEDYETVYSNATSKREITDEEFWGGQN